LWCISTESPTAPLLLDELEPDELLVEVEVLDELVDDDPPLPLEVEVEVELEPEVVDPVVPLEEPHPAASPSPASNAPVKPSAVFFDSVRTVDLRRGVTLARSGTVVAWSGLLALLGLLTACERTVSCDTDIGVCHEWVDASLTLRREIASAVCHKSSEHYADRPCTREGMLGACDFGHERMVWSPRAASVDPVRLCHQSHGRWTPGAAP